MILTGFFYILSIPFAVAEGVLIGELACTIRRLHSHERDLSITIIIALGFLLAGIRWCGNALGANVDWPFIVLLGSGGLGYSIINDQMRRLEEKDRSSRRGEQS